MLRLSVCGTAMFAEPTVAEIEEVVCLIHWGRSENSIQKTEYVIIEHVPRLLNAESCFIDLAAADRATVRSNEPAHLVAARFA